jgi:hypothetical protein
MPFGRPLNLTDCAGCYLLVLVFGGVGAEPVSAQDLSALQNDVRSKVCPADRTTYHDLTPQKSCKTICLDPKLNGGDCGVDRFGARRLVGYAPPGCEKEVERQNKIIRAHRKFIEEKCNSHAAPSATPSLRPPGSKPNVTSNLSVPAPVQRTEKPPTQRPVGSSAGAPAPLQRASKPPTQRPSPWADSSYVKAWLETMKKRNEEATARRVRERAALAAAWLRNQENINAIRRQMGPPIIGMPAGRPPVMPNRTYLPTRPITPPAAPSKPPPSPGFGAPPPPCNVPGCAMR